LKAEVAKAAEAQLEAKSALEVFKEDVGKADKAQAEALEAHKAEVAKLDESHKAELVKMDEAHQVALDIHQANITTKLLEETETRWAKYKSEIMESLQAKGSESSQASSSE